jgi:hypothetical protein
MECAGAVARRAGQARPVGPAPHTRYRDLAVAAAVTASRSLVRRNTPRLLLGSTYPAGGGDPTADQAGVNDRIGLQARPGRSVRAISRTCWFFTARRRKASGSSILTSPSTSTTKPSRAYHPVDTPHDLEAGAAAPGEPASGPPAQPEAAQISSEAMRPHDFASDPHATRHSHGAGGSHPAGLFRRVTRAAGSPYDTTGRTRS